jgi:hypothetical protein
VPSPTWTSEADRVADVDPEEPVAEQRRVVFEADPARRIGREIDRLEGIDRDLHHGREREHNQQQRGGKQEQDELPAVGEEHDSLLEFLSCRARA